jgi:hypothetical protein
MCMNEILICCPDSDNSVCICLIRLLFFLLVVACDHLNYGPMTTPPPPILIIKKRVENLCPYSRVYFLRYFVPLFLANLGPFCVYCNILNKRTTPHCDLRLNSLLSLVETQWLFGRGEFWTLLCQSWVF